ncbi:ribosomal protein S16 domain-containing protein, partial [Vararia minispora EC-137]
MPVRLRFSLHGPKHNKTFHLVAIDQRRRRNAKPIELLGIYSPRADEGRNKTMEWSVDRIRYWLNAGGALPTRSVVRLLERGGVIPPNSKYHPKA